MSYDTSSLPFWLSGPNAAETDASLTMLDELPIANWPSPAAVRGDRATALALLDAVLADQQLVVTAWYVRDRVETSAFLAGHGRASVPRDGRTLAEVAALALLVRPLLPLTDFTTLFAPFARGGPAHTPSGGPRATLPFVP